MNLKNEEVKRMNFVLAPDSFKGTLTQVEVAKTMQQVLFKKWKTAHVVMKPMADGGEGTLAALLAATDNSKKMMLNVTGPLGDKITTDIGIINSDTVVIEVATIAGLPLVPKAFRHPF